MRPHDAPGNAPLAPGYQVLLTVDPVHLGDLVNIGGHRFRVVRIVPGGALVRPRRWYDLVAIVLHRLGLV